MNLAVLLFAAAAAFPPVAAASIDYDAVAPFPQPEPATASEKTAITFKPSLRIDSGCFPYPAVNEAGETSAGLKLSIFSGSKCKGSTLGSQVYGRAVWYNGLWAIMYAWYFPQDKPSFLSFKKGQLHDWANVVVWLNNPEVERPTMIGVSPSSFVKTYSKYTPPPADGLNGMTCMINYLGDANNNGYHTVDTTWKTGGELQDLIMWEQLTDEARNALTEANFGENAKVPLIDAHFEENLKLAWPY